MRAYGGDRGRRIASSSAARRHKAHCETSSKRNSCYTLDRAIGKQLFISSRAVERHVQGIFRKLGLPDSEDDNRRVLAVLALLGH